MKKILTYNPIRSAGCVTGEKIAFQLCTILSAIFTFHATLMNCPCQFNVDISFTKADIETKMDLVMANELDI